MQLIPAPTGPQLYRKESTSTIFGIPTVTALLSAGAVLFFAFFRSGLALEGVTASCLVPAFFESGVGVIAAARWFSLPRNVE